MTTKLSAKYSLTPGVNRTLLQKYSSIAGIQSELPHLYNWLRSLLVPDAQISLIDEWSAAWNNEVWATHGYLGQLGFQIGKPNNSRANFDCEDWDGEIKLRMQLLATMGQYYFANSSQYTDEWGKTPGTRLVIDSVWVGIPGWPKRCIITSNYGTGKEGDYVQGMCIGRVTCIGSGGLGAHDPITAAGGIYIENGGSTVKLDRVVCDGYNGTGIEINGAIPLELDHVRTFRNNVAGVLLRNGAEASLIDSQLEGDDNAVLFWAPDGAGFAELTIKSEQGKKSQRGQTIMRLGGQFKVEAKIKSAVYAGMPDAMVQIDSEHINSYLTVPLLSDETGTQATVGYRNLIRTPSATYRMPAQAEGCGFIFKAGQLHSNMR